MRKSLLIGLFLCFTAAAASATETASVFKEDAQEELQALENLEQYVLAHPDLTLEEIKSQNPELLAGLVLEEKTDNLYASTTELPGNIPAFWWGCCLSLAGVAIVYFTTKEDKEMLKKAAFGCLVNGILVGGGCLLYSLLGGGYYYW